MAAAVTRLAGNLAPEPRGGRVTRTLSIINRETGDVATVMDISDMSPPELSRMWDGLVRRVDFERWMAVDSANEDA